MEVTVGAACYLAVKRVSLGEMREIVWPNTLVLCFHSIYSRANASKSLPQAQATFWLKSVGWSFLRTKLAGLSKGEALVKAAISEAPMVCFLALTQAELRCTNPVWFSCRKALKAVTRADMVAHTSQGCFSNWVGFRVLLEVCVILNTYIYSGSSGVCTLHPAAHTRMTEVEALGIGPTVRLPSSITGVISRKFFHSRGLPRPPGRGNPLEWKNDREMTPVILLEALAL